LPTADSGLISTDNLEYFNLFSKLSWLGINTSTYQRSNDVSGYKWLYDVEELGFKANGNSIMAGIAKVQLKYLERDNIRRREIAAIYISGLSMLDQVNIPKVYEEIASSQHLFQIRVPSELRNQLINYLNVNGIDVGVHYRLSTHYRMYSSSHHSVANAEIIESQIISLPLHLRMTNGDVKKVIEVIRNFFGKNI
jgi:dTDP-4-amino-4,6-dideoxygalactose transaminase